LGTTRFAVPIVTQYLERHSSTAANSAMVQLAGRHGPDASRRRWVGIVIQARSMGVLQNTEASMTAHRTAVYLLVIALASIINGCAGHSKVVFSNDTGQRITMAVSIPNGTLFGYPYQNSRYWVELEADREWTPTQADDLATGLPRSSNQHTFFGELRLYVGVSGDWYTIDLGRDLPRRVRVRAGDSGVVVSVDQQPPRPMRASTHEQAHRWIWRK